MVKNILLILTLILVLASCKSKSRTVYHKPKVTTRTVVKNKTKPRKPNKQTKKIAVSKKVKPQKKVPNKPVFTISKTDKIINNALSFRGTKYLYGGTTKKGMDCSGLIYTSYRLAAIDLPRTSREQSKKGVNIPLSKVMIGDLLFFKTSKKNVISHVGLVTNVNGNTVKFIHSSNSKGVVISSLNEKYWAKAFAKAKRIN